MDQTTIRTQTYTLTTQDYLHYYVVALVRLFVRWPAAIFAWGLFVGLPVLVALPALLAHHYVQATASALPLLLVWLFVIPVMGLWRTWRTVKANTTLRGTRIAIVSDRQFSVEGDTFATHQQWSNFRELIETPGKIFLVIRGSGSAFVVRKAAIGDRNAVAAFTRAARRHIGNAKNPQVRAFEEPVKASADDGVASPSYSLTFLVFARYYVLTLYRTLLLRPATFLSLAAVFIGLPLWYNRQAVMAGYWQDAFFDGGRTLVGFLLLFPLLMTPISWMMTRRQPASRGLRTVSLSASGVRAFGDSFDVTVQWTSIHAIGPRFGLLLFWTGPAAGIFVPRSVFPDTAAAKAFQDQAMAWWRAAKNPAAQ